MNNNGYIKWGKCKVRYDIDEFGFWLNWEDIANILNLDANFKWVSYEDTKSILYNKYDDKPFVDSFLIWLENEVKPILVRGMKRLKEEKDLREQTKEVLPTIRKAGSYAIQNQFKLPQTQSKAVVKESTLHNLMGQENKGISKIESEAVKTDIQVFNFEAKEIRVIIKDNEPLFCAFDLCRVLEYKNGKDTINRIFGDGVVKCYPIKDRLNRVQEAKFLTESQMYKLIMRSKAKCAEALQDFVCNEVLPTIRKTGSYAMQNQYKLPQTYAEALRELANTHEALELAKAQIESDKPKVDFANNVSKAENEISIGEFAKILNIKGLGEKNLFKWLRDEGYLRLNNMPYQEFINKGYFRVIEKTREDKNGRIYTYTQTLITGQGQIYLQEVKNG